MKMTQNEKILKYIKEHGSITRREAAYELGIFELAARINGLERAGYSFTKTTEKYTDQYGNIGYCTRYAFEV